MIIWCRGTSFYLYDNAKGNTVKENFLRATPTGPIIPSLVFFFVGWESGKEEENEDYGQDSVYTVAKDSMRTSSWHPYRPPTARRLKKCTSEHSRGEAKNRALSEFREILRRKTRRNSL